MTTTSAIRPAPRIARVTSVLLKGGKRQEGDPVCWAEIEQERNGTYYVNPIKFQCEGTFSLNQAFDRFEIIQVEDAPSEIRAFLNRRWAQRRKR